MIKKTEWENFFGKMEEYIKVNGKKINRMVKEK